MRYTLDNFYKSREWERLRAQLMLERVDEQGQLICAHCGRPITKAYDCIAHHKVKLTDDNVNDAAVSFNPDNIELIHFKCHNREHQRYDGFRQRVYLVYGAPCSGKTTWVKEVANQDDLVLDIDSIWEAICTSDKYHKPNRLKANVFGIRDCILDQIRTRQGTWRNAYVIGGYPLRSDRDRLCDLLGAEKIFIDTSMADCLARAKTEEWKGFVRDWFDAYTA